MNPGGPAPPPRRGLWSHMPACRHKKGSPRHTRAGEPLGPSSLCAASRLPPLHSGRFWHSGLTCRLLVRRRGFVLHSCWLVCSPGLTGIAAGWINIEYSRKTLEGVQNTKASRVFHLGTVRGIDSSFPVLLFKHRINCQGRLQLAGNLSHLHRQSSRQPAL